MATWTWLCYRRLCRLGFPHWCQYRLEVTFNGVNTILDGVVIGWRQIQDA